MYTIDKELCINCGNCVKVCTMNIFTREEDGTIASADRACMDCLHCAAACPTRAIGHSEKGREACYGAPAPAGTMLAAIQSRRSVRNFKDVTPEKDLIASAIAGTAYGPSAKNRRPLHWTAVLGKEKVQELLALGLAWAKGDADMRHLVWLSRRGYDPVTCGAPCLLFVHIPPEQSVTAQTDAAIAATLAEQLLVEGGLGTCWGGYMTRMANACPALREALALPEGHTVCATLMVGVPDEHYPNVAARESDPVHWL